MKKLLLIILPLLFIVSCEEESDEDTSCNELLEEYMGAATVFNDHFLGSDVDSDSLALFCAALEEATVALVEGECSGYSLSDMGLTEGMLDSMKNGQYCELLMSGVLLESLEGAWSIESIYEFDNPECLADGNEELIPVTGDLIISADSVHAIITESYSFSHMCEDEDGELVNDTSCVYEDYWYGLDTITVSDFREECEQDEGTMDEDGNCVQSWDGRWAYYYDHETLEYCSQLRVNTATTPIPAGYQVEQNFNQAAAQAMYAMGIGTAEDRCLVSYSGKYYTRIFN